MPVWYAIHIGHLLTFEYIGDHGRLIRDWKPDNAPCKVAFVAEKKVVAIADFTEVKPWKTPKVDAFAWCFSNQHSVAVKIECGDYCKLLRVQNTSLLPMLNAWAQKELDEYFLSVGGVVADTPVLGVEGLSDIPVMVEPEMPLDARQYVQMSIFDLLGD